MLKSGSINSVLWTEAGCTVCIAASRYLCMYLCVWTAPHHAEQAVVMTAFCILIFLSDSTTPCVVDTTQTTVSFQLRRHLGKVILWLAVCDGCTVKWTSRGRAASVGSVCRVVRGWQGPLQEGCGGRRVRALTCLQSLLHSLPCCWATLMQLSRTPPQTSSIPPHLLLALLKKTYRSAHPFLRPCRDTVGLSLSTFSHSGLPCLRSGHLALKSCIMLHHVAPGC